MCEIWKDIEGYEGYYQVSNLGRVKSLERLVIGKNGKRYFCESKELFGTVDSTGYLMVTLRKDGTRKTISVHRLVAKTFIPNPDGKPTVDHINRVTTDNRVDNLRWATMSEQADNRDDTKREKPVIGIKGETVLYFESVSKAERHGFNQSAICNCCRGRVKTHHGYTWYYFKG